MKAIYGRKLGMTRHFTESGEMVPVTVLELGPNVVHQVKTKEKEGYQAVQVGFDLNQKPRRVNRALTEHFGKAQGGFPKLVAELRFDVHGGSEMPEYKPGDKITLEGMFEPGSRVDVVGTSIGKGFAGVIKRHHMAGFPGSHGTHEYFRHGGSIGCRKFPGRVFKNKRMAGHMGDIRVLQEGLQVVAVRTEDNALLVRGSVPGPKNGFIYVRQSVKARKPSNKPSAE